MTELRRAAWIGVAGWGGDLDRVAPAVQAAGDGFDLPARHLPQVVAPFAGATAVRVDGQAIVGAALNVINVADRRITERIPAAPITKA